MTHLFSKDFSNNFKQLNFVKREKKKRNFQTLLFFDFLELIFLFINFPMSQG